MGGIEGPEAIGAGAAPPPSPSKAFPTENKA